MKEEGSRGIKVKFPFTPLRGEERVLVSLEVPPWGDLQVNAGAPVG